MKEIYLRERQLFVWIYDIVCVCNQIVFGSLVLSFLSFDFSCFSAEKCQHFIYLPMDSITDQIKWYGKLNVSYWLGLICTCIQTILFALRWSHLITWAKLILIHPYWTNKLFAFGMSYDEENVIHVYVGIISEMGRIEIFAIEICIKFQSWMVMVIILLKLIIVLSLEFNWLQHRQRRWIPFVFALVIICFVCTRIRYQNKHWIFAQGSNDHWMWWLVTISLCGVSHVCLCSLCCSNYIRRENSRKFK